MSDLYNLVGSPQPNDVQQADAKHPSRLRPLLAGLLSAMIPGVGQLIVGQRRRGYILLILFLAVLFCFWPLRLPQSYFLFIALSWSWIGLSLYAGGSAIWQGRASRSPGFSRWWLAVFVPVTFVVLWVEVNTEFHVAGFRAFIAPSSSMEATVRQGDRIVADMNYFKSHRPQDQEAVLFKRGETFFIKRVIAGGGETVYEKAGHVYVNGEALSEPYAQHTGEPLPWMMDIQPVAVPAGKYFVMGDNRDVSLDSRSSEFGFVAADSIVGKPLYILQTDRSRTIR